MIDEQVIDEALRQVIDPEVGINIVDLGLVYSMKAEGDRVRVVMTMTTPACPMHSYLTERARATLRERLPAAAAIEVELAWDPPWTPQMMSSAARKMLGWSH